MSRHFRMPAFAAATLLLASATSGSAAEIKVLNANALTIAMKELADAYTKETGNPVTFVGVNPGQIEPRLKAGEMYDLVIAPTAAAAALEKEGKWRPGSRHPLARVGIGVAVREGVKVDLSSVEFDPQGAARCQADHPQQLHRRRLERDQRR